MKDVAELYIHIPFCVRKCNYCDFLSFPSTDRAMAEYVWQLMDEAAASAALCEGKKIRSVFFGGGTPSLPAGELIEAVMQQLRKYYDLEEDAEITLECNPGTSAASKLEIYRKAGINRLSIGLQSADNSELRMLGRIHTFEEFLALFEAARKNGFDNINVDLINCIPMQTLKVWKRTLRNVLMLRPEHISVYNLIVEEDTPFFDLHQKGLLMLPDEDEQEKIDDLTFDFLEAQGYRHYEVSNWAKPGFECRHNKGYWTGVPYLGLGLGASSLMGDFRWSNTRDMNEYMKADFRRRKEAPEEIRKDRHRLEQAEQMEEFMILGLRLTEGVSEQAFFNIFGRQITNVYGKAILRDLEEGWMERAEGRLRFTRKGMNVSNVLLQDFLPEKNPESLPENASE